MSLPNEQMHSVFTLGLQSGVSVEEAVQKMRARIAGTPHQLERIVRADKYELKKISPTTKRPIILNSFTAAA